MNDPIFEELLEHTVNLSRPQVEVESDLQVAVPTYDLLEAGVSARLRPIDGSIDRSVLGRFPRATAAAYLLPTNLQANDRLSQVVATTVLTEPASPGTDTLTVASTDGFTPGEFVHLLGAAGWEEVGIAAVADEETLELVEPLTAGFAEEDTVEAVVSYEVLGAIDQAGAGHHLKAILRHREM